MIRYNVSRLVAFFKVENTEVIVSLYSCLSLLTYVVIGVARHAHLSVFNKDTYIDLSLLINHKSGRK